MTTGRHQLYFINGLTVAFAAGVFCAEWMMPPLLLCYQIIGVLLLWCFAALYRRSEWVGYGIVLVFFLLGLVRYTQSAVLPPDDISGFTDCHVTVRGTVCDFSAVKAGWNEGEIRVRYVVQAAELRRGEQTIPVRGKFILDTAQPQAVAAGRYGDRIQAAGIVRALHSYGNPGQPDGAASLRRRGITARLHAGKSGVRLQPPTEASWLRAVDAMRGNLLVCMERAMPKQDAAALFAMLFGGYAGLDPELLAAFTATGIVHILSVSGSHITMLAASLEWIGRVLRLRRRVTIGMIIAAVAVYAVFAGCVPPVIRSAAMGILTFAAVAADRERDARRILALVLLTMLAAEPGLLYDLSFQLSAAATAGLLYLAPVLRALLHGLPDWIGTNFAITLSAQLAVLPFLAWYFHTVSLSALFANLVAAPLIEFMVIGGLSACVIGLLLPFIQKILFVLCSLALGLVYTILSKIAAIPGGALYLPAGGIAYGVLYEFLLFLSVWCFLYRREFCVRRLRRHGMIFALIVSCGAAAFMLWLNRPGDVRVHFIDVGQGDAMLLTTPHGKAVLIDAGGVEGRGDFDVGARVVVPYLHHYGVRELEYLILTHAHDDHAGGAAAVWQSLAVRHVMIGREDRRDYARVLRTSLRQCGDLIPAYTGQSFTVDGVEFTVIRAAESALQGTGNEVSNVIQIRYGDHSFLITGDLDAAGERAVLDGGAAIGSTVLKVAHHGSKTSSTDAFLTAVRPAYAVISVGADNRFGHPNQDVVRRLEQHQSRVLRTDQAGAIVFDSDGVRLDVTMFRKK